MVWARRKKRKRRARRARRARRRNKAARFLDFPPELLDIIIDALEPHQRFIVGQVCHATRLRTKTDWRAYVEAMRPRNRWYFFHALAEALPAPWCHVAFGKMNRWSDGEIKRFRAALVHKLGRRARVVTPRRRRWAKQDQIRAWLFRVWRLSSTGAGPELVSVLKAEVKKARVQKCQNAS